MVPITSNLAGYAAFWTRVVVGVVAVVVVAAGANLWLLWRILKAVTR